MPREEAGITEAIKVTAVGRGRMRERETGRGKKDRSEYEEKRCRRIERKTGAAKSGRKGEAGSSEERKGNMSRIAERNRERRREKERCADLEMDRVRKKRKAGGKEAQRQSTAGGSGDNGGGKSNRGQRRSEAE